jgi:CubicO group peptidase (beta-lactamase class C family)
MRRKMPLWILVLVTVLAGCARLPPQAAVYPGAEWAWASSPESLGWSSDKLAAARAYAERIGSAAVMIVNDGVVVDAWGDLERKYQCHSMRKSLISALYGIYVADGRIDLTRTLEDLGIDDLTPLTEVEKTATVADLLSARSGVYIEAAGEAPSMKALRPARGSHAPGTFWYYNNWDFNALGTIFDQLSGEKDIYTAFDKRIADPIGMQDYDPGELSYAYEPYSRHPYYGFRMSTRDLARFGLLFLRDGRWSELQVIPADWVRQSSASHSIIGPQSGYGYLWWTGEGAGLLPNVDEGPGTFMASGYGGHTVIVIPSRNLVVVHRADTDAGRMVDEGSIGTLLWMILDAAGETGIGDPPLLERAVGTRLTADTLPKVLQACTLRTTQGSAEIIVTFGLGQTVSVSAYGAVLVETRWWLDGDNYCHDLGPESGGRQCFQLVRNDNQLTFFDLDGYVSMRFDCAQR